MRWFLNLKTMKKLVLGFGLVCVIMGIVGYTGLNKMAVINGMLNTLYERELVGLSHIKEANTTLIKIGRAVRQIAIEPDVAERKRTRTILDQLCADLEKLLDKSETTLVTEEGRAKLAEAREGLKRFEAQMQTLVEAATAESNTGIEDAAILDGLKKLRVEGDQLDTAMSELAALKEQLGKQAYDESDVVYAESRNLVVTVIVIGLVVGMSLGIYIARVISRPLSDAVQILTAVAGGDFTGRLDIDTKDEVGEMAQALNQSIGSVRAALIEVRMASETLATASQQLSSSSEEISSGAQEQASNLEETASSLEEITSTVKQNADNAQQANQLATGARDVAEKGGQVVNEAVEGMAEINRASKKIADIITAIDEIAFQTNLLALNAAVEAARAGEQGRGFAVVAGEVRNLAQRSAAAAKEIKGLIQDSVRKVETGSELVNKSGHTLQEIVTSVKRVTDIVAEIAAASREQSTGIDQVSKAVAQMDTVTQANASQTEELSGTAESLSGQAHQLQQLVAQFRLGDHGGAPAPAKHAPSVPATNGHAKHPAPKKPEPAKNGHHSNGHHRELDLVGATNGSNRLNGHFEEF